MPASTYGRQVTVSATNKSGGALIAGDVVVVDTTNNLAFTTSTAGAVVNLIIAVCQESIANNASGRFLTNGYAALINTNASVTRGNFGKTHTVAKQATDAGASRVSGTFCQFLTGGTTPDAIVYPSDLGGSSLTNPMTAADDIIIGGASGTPAKLVAGAAGAHLTIANGHVTWNAGTSFPGSPASHDRYYRTDVLGGIECIYDGTRWLGPLFVEGIGGTDAVNGFTGTLTTPSRWSNFGAAFDLWIVEFDVNTFVNGTNTGSAFWTLTFGKVNISNTATSLGTVDTSADTASNWTAHKLSVGAAITNASFPGGFQINATKTSTPAALFLNAKMLYRIIVT